MIRFTPNYRSAVLWHRHRAEWHLTASGTTVAKLVPNEGLWLSLIWDLPSHGWHAVDFGTLAHAKACIAQWWATRTTDRAFTAYSKPRIPEIKPE